MPIDAAQRQELTNAAGLALADAVPAGWRRIDLLCTTAPERWTLTVLPETGTTPPVPEKTRESLLRLREAMAEPDGTSWSSARLFIDAPGTVYVKYHFAADLPFGPLSTVEDQHRLWGLVSNLVTSSCPPDWAEAAIAYRAAGEHVELRATVRRATDGAVEPWTPRPEVGELLARLRAAMYRAGRGTWNEVTAVVHLDSRIDSRYTWDDEPAWDTEPPASAAVRELADFPRDDGMVPGWLAERAGKAAVRTLAHDPDDALATRAALTAAEQAAVELGLDPSRYRVGESADGAWCLAPDNGRWSVFWAQGEQRHRRATFPTALEAARAFVGHLHLNQAAFRGELPPDAKRPTRAWPIQPMSDDGGLSLYEGKQLVTLPPGIEVDRYGDPSGNTLFAARTGFTHRSHKAEREQREYHLYRLTRSVRAITGTAVPWYEQAGGGTAYVLARSVADLLADGSLIELA
ncbi:TNT domain-containing protein [Amycolatopsis sp. 195334CR]|uniref:TNT domain-containing protein n=1 Tax=Amycolatopsis sp. 195334CR TaxID=2814588 RepID=UPI001A8DBA2D|nr:TNT domain-containing protein [Amycolatopsis sp. 195334CR]MBN6039836.1 TNT domain-containing protein [Amycolatopsis sp. 195334CR]